MPGRPSAKVRLRRVAFLACATLALLIAGLAFTPFASAQHAPPSDGAPALPRASGSASPAPSGSAKVDGDGFVRLKDKKVLELKVPRAGTSAVDRARAATRALEGAAVDANEDDVRVDQLADTAVLYVGKTPVLQLGPDDATAWGDASLAVSAESTAAKFRDVLQSERRRRAAANTVFSISLLVFSALIALLLIRKLGELADRARTWVVENPDRAPTLRAFGIDIFSPHIFRGGLSVTLSAAKLLAQIGIGYAWVLFALSLFESTRSYTAQLTKAVVGPLTGLTQRLAESVPLLVVGAVSLFALYVLTRFVGLFFRSVSKGDAEVGWISPDLAIPTSVLVRGAILVIALVLGIPVVTGSSEGALARAGIVALSVLAIATVPLFATAAVGIVVVYGRRLRAGDIADVGGTEGRITGIDLLEVRLEDEHGFEVRVPHLLALRYPTRVLGRTRITRASVTVSTSADQSAVKLLLTEAAQSLGQNAKVELAHFDLEGARYEVSCRIGKKDARAELLAALADALLREKIPLGVHRPRATDP